MKSICYCGLLLLLFSSCNSRTTGLQAVDYHIVPPTSLLSEETVFSSLLKEFRYIIPEASEESMFSYISKAYIYQGRIYISDRDSQDKILVFDSNNGKYLFGIGRQGRAGNEYTRLGSFTIDKERGRILILDYIKNKVLVYNAMTGEFQDSFELGFTAMNIEYIDKNTLAFEGIGANQDVLCITDMDGGNMSSYFHPNGKNRVSLINPFSRGDNNEVIFRTYLSDSLHTITKQGPVFSRFVDFGSDALTWEKFISYSEVDRENIRQYLGEYRAGIRYYAETNSHINFIYFDKGAPVCTVFNKKDSDTFSYSVFLYNDIVFDQYVPLIVAADDGFFIGQSDAYSIVENIERLSLTDISEDLKNLTSSDNPVLTFLKF
jgi:hypothetical protein